MADGNGDKTGWIVAGLTAGGAALVAVIGAVVGALKSRRDGQREDKADVWQRQASLIDRLDKQLAAVQAEQQRAVVAEMTCREEVARLRAMGQWLYGLLQDHHAQLARMSPPGSVAELPAFPDFGAVPATTRASQEFVQRQIDQATTLLHDEVRSQSDKGADSHDPPR